MQVDAKPITCQLKVKEGTSTLFVSFTDTQYYMQHTQHSVRAWFPKATPIVLPTNIKYKEQV